MPNKRELDETILMQHYMDGRTDREMAILMDCASSFICEWRNKNELPPNGGIFSWQTELKPSQLKLIPQKYWNPRFKRVAV